MIDLLSLAARYCVLFGVTRPTPMVELMDILIQATRKLEEAVPLLRQRSFAAGRSREPPWLRPAAGLALSPLGLTAEEIAPGVAGLRQRPAAWVEVMIRFELGLEPPERGRAIASAVTIALAYIVSGSIPLSPYMIVPSSHALGMSVGVTLLALTIFGFVKGHVAGAQPVRSAPPHDDDRRSGGGGVPHRQGDLMNREKEAP